MLTYRGSPHTLPLPPLPASHLAPAPAGKFYTLTTGSNERRWNKMKTNLTTVVRSFTLIN